MMQRNALKAVIAVCVVCCARAACPFTGRVSSKASSTPPTTLQPYLGQIPYANNMSIPMVTLNSVSGVPAAVSRRPGTR